MAPNLHKAIILHNFGVYNAQQERPIFGTARHVKDPRLPCEVATMNSLPVAHEALGKRNLAQTWVLVKGFDLSYENKETIVIYMMAT